MKLQNVLELHTGRKISNMATAENYIKGLSDKIKEFMIKLLKKIDVRYRSLRNKNN